MTNSYNNINSAAEIGSPEKWDEAKRARERLKTPINQMKTSLTKPYIQVEPNTFNDANKLWNTRADMQAQRGLKNMV